MEPLAQLVALYTILLAEEHKGGPVAEAIKTMEIDSPSPYTLHLNFTQGGKKTRIAVVATPDSIPILYTVFWPVVVTAHEIRSGGGDMQEVKAEVNLTCLDLMTTVGVVNSVVLTEYIKTQNDGEEGSK